MEGVPEVVLDDSRVDDGPPEEKFKKRQQYVDKDDEIRRLRIQVTQLKNIIQKLTSAADNGVAGKGRRAKSKDRPFDHTLYKKRHVLFRVAYFGWDYHGFAVQENTAQTIESELFRALLTTRLIQSRETSNYHRCGRTDKGVSASHQVISIDVRTNMTEGRGVLDYDGCRAHERKKSEDESEIDYCKVLNANLPSNIQVIAWSPCSSSNVSARFDCRQRTYKYFFPRSDLNLQSMVKAGQKLVGSHDFRNFCKLDVNNGVTTYVRRVISVDVDVCSRPSGAADDDAYDVCVLTLTGNAFLWHQIRCIMSVLFLVGQGKEDPGVIDELLDVEKNPRRPQYVMAADFPLNLFHCMFDDGEVQWQYEQEAVVYFMRQFQSLWTEYQMKASMLKSTLDSLRAELPASLGPTAAASSGQLEAVLPKTRNRTYVPLMRMQTCPSLEEAMDRHQKRRRIDKDSGEEEQQVDGAGESSVGN